MSKIFHRHLQNALDKLKKYQDGCTQDFKISPKDAHALAVYISELSKYAYFNEIKKTFK